MPTISCGALEVPYSDEGSGPPIVWIPGTGLCGSSWELQFGQFSDRYRCLTLDLRGSGRTGGEDGAFTVADLAADVAAWMDALAVGPATVVGLSLGSAIGQELAIARPDLVERLVLLATWSSSTAEHHIRRHFESRLYALENGPLDVYAQFAFWMSSHTLYDTDRERQTVVEALLAAHMSRNLRGTAGHFRADLAHETRDRLGQITCPTLVVHGDEDLITLPRYNRTVADLVPGATLATISAAGHLSWLERPDELKALLDEFLGAPPGDPAPDGGRRRNRRAHTPGDRAARRRIVVRSACPPGDGAMTDTSRSGDGAEAAIAVPGVPARPSWVIRRKIVPPPLPDSVVPRRRLETLLTGLLDQHRLVFVYASAGAGKTTAILQAAQRLHRPLAWLDLDATDVTTGRLLVYLEAALAVHVPEVAGVAAAALAAQLPHAEVAGLLAESVGDRPLLVVLDDAERLAGEPEALEVLAAFARYMPPSVRLVIASRAELPFRSSLGESPWVAAVGEEDLALTVEEATDALAAAGRTDIDPVDAIVETGGWVTGVLFEAWRAPDHVIGLGGEADPLHGYLATEILGQLSEADADFLDEPRCCRRSPRQAQALGLADAPTRMHSLSRRRVPVSWLRSGRRDRGAIPGSASSCSSSSPGAPSRNRRSCTVHRPAAVQRAPRRGSGAGVHRRGASQRGARGHPPGARADHRAHRLRPGRGVARDAGPRPSRGRRLAGSGGAHAGGRPGELRRRRGPGRPPRGGRPAVTLAASSARAAGFMAWCYLHAGRVDDIDQVLAVAPQGPDVDAARYSMAVVRDEPAVIDRPSLATLSGGPMDALVLRTRFDLGRLSLLTSAPQSPWAAKAAESWLVSGLLITGHTERAFELLPPARRQLRPERLAAARCSVPG